MKIALPYSNLIDAVENSLGVYPGDLRHYYGLFMVKATNLAHVYHGWTHTNRTMWLEFVSGVHYKRLGLVTPLDIRKGMIKGLFHDWDHSSVTGNDDPEIAAAQAAVHKYLLPEDREFEAEIVGDIGATRFPYLPTEMTLARQLLREIDITQALDETWMQITLKGLGGEMGKTVREMLAMQEPFLENFVKRGITTDWGKATFPETLIDNKIRQARQLIRMYDEAASL
jgi:hypothetical protein